MALYLFACVELMMTKLMTEPDHKPFYNFTPLQDLQLSLFYLFLEYLVSLPLLHSSSQQLLWTDCKGGNTLGKGDDLCQPVSLHRFVAREGKHLP